MLILRPFSEQIVRVPSATAGVLNVVLLFVLARMMFGRTRPAVIAAVLLMLTPAHFIQSRIATMQIAPVTCVIAWLIFMVRYIRDNRRRDLVAASVCLGLGMYTYVAALVIMPLYFAVMLGVAWRLRAAGAPATHLPAACAVFAVALVPLVLWFVAHPQQLVGLTGYYTHGEYNQNVGWRGFPGANAISHLDAWWECYCILFTVSPYYLSNQWELYTRAPGRPELSSRTTTRFEETLPCPGATALAVPGDARFANWRATPIRELDGTVRLAVYRR